MVTALIDADILLYQAANGAEKVFNFGNDIWSVAADLKEAQGAFMQKVREIEVDLGVPKGEAVLCVTDPKGTFRYDLYPAYKGNRTGRKPLVFKPLRDWLVSEAGGVFLPNLEADDTMGILATNGSCADPVIVTLDKDLRSVPGKHYNQSKPKEGVVEVSAEEARRFHLIQTVAGDPVDNIKGVPRVGMVKAKAALEKDGYSWATVLDTYEKALLTEEDALLNARLTKILTADEWDAEDQEVILWEPGVMA